MFKVIERFSEDIDVSMDRGFLGFGGDNEPEAGGSNKEKQRRIDALPVACQQKIAIVLSKQRRVAEARDLFAFVAEPVHQLSRFHGREVKPRGRTFVVRRQK